MSITDPDDVSEATPSAPSDRSDAAMPVLLDAGASASQPVPPSTSVIWTVPAILPLLPGLTIVRGIIALRTVNGMLEVASAIGTGFALGAGVAFGSILVVVARRAWLAAEGVIGPAIGGGRTGLGLMISSAERPAGEATRKTGPQNGRTPDEPR